MPHADSTGGISPARGLTTRDVARRYRVSEDKVRAWIRCGRLSAINTASAKCGKPRYVVTPEAIAEFERVHSAAAPPRAVRRRRQPAVIDFY